jgi:hypothetical protein
MKEMRDVFLCHASEDKQAILRPLVSALDQAGVTHWYDEAEIRWGDSITEKVNEGLRLSRFVLVVFSDTFLQKNWPQRELNAALNIEASTGEVRVLPLIIGTPEQRKRILEAYPILNDKAFMSWNAGIPAIVKGLLARLSRDQTTGVQRPQSRRDEMPEIVIPDIRRSYSQREKDHYLREAFQVVKTYFETGAKEISIRHPDVEVDVEEIHKYKFVCSIYRHGEIVSRCKIWLGGPGSSNAISYASGTHIDVNNDSTYNDWLNIDDSGPQLGFEASRMAFGFSAAREFEGILSARKAAEYLWLRTIEPLKYK